MKKALLITFSAFIFVFAGAQGTWTQKANFGGTSRIGAAGFSIGTKCYLGTGSGTALKKDFWEWDQTANSWTQKSDFGGSARDCAVGFSIGTKGYIGTGGSYNSSSYTKDFWEWDQASNTWSQKADFGGTARLLAVGFSIGSKGYIGTGAGSTGKKKDFWEYDPSGNTWVQKADFGGTGREGGVGFVINSKGYIGTGDDGSGPREKDFWEWDQATNTWAQKADVGTQPRSVGAGFSIGTKGYIGIGYDGAYLQDFWEWDQASNTWIQKANYAAGAGSSVTGFSVGGYGYLGVGGSSGTGSQNFWQFDPGNSPFLGLWTQKASFGLGQIRTFASSFSIGNKGYVGLGEYPLGTAHNDWWEWDQAANAWTQKANFSGSARGNAAAFAIGSKGYVGTGGVYSGGPFYSDFWEFDPIANSWTARASFPGTARMLAVGFSIGTKGYIGTGRTTSGGGYKKDFWEWDQSTNTWTQKLDLTGVARESAAGFSVGTKGYIGTGDNGSVGFKDFWEWDQAGNTWTQRTDFPGLARANASAFSLVSSGCIGAGGASGTYYADFWEWDPATSLWTRIADLAFGGTSSATGFAIGNRGYVELGASISTWTTQNFWEYSRCTAPPFNTSQTNISCGGGYNGSAAIIPTGGIPPFTYVWNTFPIQTTSSISNLSPGVYIGTITDGVGCSATTNFNITQASAPTASISSINSNCSSSNTGSISLNVSGGTPAYTYSWSHGATTQNASGLMPGVYSVVISDANGCSNMYIDTVGAVSPSYSLAFTANPQAGTAPFTPAFANATPNMANYNFTWYFGDGSSAANNGPTVFHTYQFNGLYDVTLVATSIATGCSDTLTKPGFIFATGGAGCTHTASVTPTGPINTCQGDTVILACNTDPTFTYQWNVNSISISGATGNSFSATQSGYYGVTIVKNNCPVTSSAVQINVSTNPPAPSISSNGSMVACIGGSVTLTATNIPGVTYLWSTGGTSQSIVVTSGGTYSVAVSNSAGCGASTITSVSSGVTSLPICMVTVDSTSTKNQIVWTKSVTTAIDSFKIYREVASAYKLVGSVPYSALSTFTDNTTGVNPKITAYKYKMTVVDTCGDESPLSNFHRTIHLSIGAAIPCGYNLSWNDYIGLPISQYRIMRDSAGMGWEALDSVSFGTTAWTDINCYPPQDTIAYRLEIDNPGGCVISIKDPQPMANLNLSKSNIQKNYQTATSVSTPVTLPNIAILPNPSSGLFTVRSDANMISIEVMNLLGEKIYSSKAASNKVDIDLTDKTEGVYLMRVNTLNGSSVRKIIVNK